MDGKNKVKTIYCIFESGFLYLIYKINMNKI